MMEGEQWGSWKKGENVELVYKKNPCYWMDELVVDVKEGSSVHVKTYHGMLVKTLGQKVEKVGRMCVQQM